MFLSLFPSRLKYQQTHIHREKVLLLQGSMIHAEGLNTPEMQDGSLRATYGRHTPERGCLRRLRGPRLTVAGGSMKGNKSRRWVLFHIHCALHGKAFWQQLCKSVTVSVRSGFS